MSDPFVAEIRIFGFNFAPKGWATCDGQLLPISQNTALFSLLGTFFGEPGGAPNVTLLTTEIPFHQHALQASVDPGDLAAPSNTRSLARSQPFIYKQPAGAAAPQALADAAVGLSGGGLPHNNMMPSLTLNFCIAMQGIFPPRG